MSDLTKGRVLWLSPGIAYIHMGDSEDFQVLWQALEDNKQDPDELIPLFNRKDTLIAINPYTMEVMPEKKHSSRIQKVIGYGPLRRHGKKAERKSKYRKAILVERILE